MQKSGLSVAEKFLEYVNRSPTPFHAVAQARARLLAANYVELNEREPWDILPGGKYFFTRNRTTLFGFAVGGKYKPGNGFVMIGAHTDSPVLRVKPVSRLDKAGYQMVGVECYGGGLWHTWFDRDLTIAGNVIVNNNGKYENHLVHVARPILRIPNLAIHLNRSVSTDGFKFNFETQLAPILASRIGLSLNETDLPDASNPDPTGESRRHQPLLISLLCLEIGCEPEQILDFELSLTDTQPAVIGGLLDEFIFSPRLDNLMSCFLALEALDLSLPTLADDASIRFISLFDHEEVGSGSAHGADSALLEWVLRRITGPGPSNFECAIAKSFLISSDMAHALHPNYSDKHEDLHRPYMSAGPVLKFNANQRYATTSHTATLIREIARKHDVPLQEFVVRNDVACGSTIGPIISANLAIRTIDIGNPQLSMHSIREQCGVEDVQLALTLYTAYFNEFTEFDSRMSHE